MADVPKANTSKQDEDSTQRGVGAFGRAVRKLTPRKTSLVNHLAAATGRHPDCQAHKVLLNCQNVDIETFATAKIEVNATATFGVASIGAIEMDGIFEGDVGEAVHNSCSILICWYINRNTYRCSRLGSFLGSRIHHRHLDRKTVRTPGWSHRSGPCCCR